jgi:hypothetical protein
MKKALGVYDEAFQSYVEAQKAKKEAEKHMQQAALSGNNERGTSGEAPPAPGASQEDGDTPGSATMENDSGDQVGTGMDMFENAIPEDQFKKELAEFLDIVKRQERDGEDFVKADTGEGYGSMTLYMAAHCAIRYGKR